MFEKFTEKALEAVTVARDEAIRLGHNQIYPEHILLGIASLKTNLCARLINFSGIKRTDILITITNLHRNDNKTTIEITFSEEAKNLFKRIFDIAKRAGSNYILTEHIFIALLENKDSTPYKILKDLDFDISKAMTVVKNFGNKKIKKQQHPEGEISKDADEKYNKILSVFKESQEIFNGSVSKLSTSQYEILGTEQIMQAILESNNESLKATLSGFGLNIDSFTQKLNENTSRQAEFEKKQIIFTPNAFKTMMLAIETATELGSVKLSGEHIILGLLKSKSGIAYNIFKELNINDETLKDKIIKPIEKQMPETLIILRLAKQESRRVGKNIVGSEMILLGIIEEGTGIGAKVLSKLGISLKDTRTEIEKIIGFGDEYETQKTTFSARAKKIIDIAWAKAKKHNSNKINSEHLLYAITKQPDSIAMKALINLGADIIEIKQGIQAEINKRTEEQNEK